MNGCIRDKHFVGLLETDRGGIKEKEHLFRLMWKQHSRLGPTWEIYFSLIQDHSIQPCETYLDYKVLGCIELCKV